MKADTCASPNLPSLEQALTQIFAALPKNASYEHLPLKQALNRVVAEDIHSTVDVPSFKNSSMDGYALNSQDSDLKSLRVVGTSWAGKPYNEHIKPGECIRVFTGAYVPDDCDCVVMQENVTRSKETIKIKKAPQAFDNIRNIADDITCGQIIIKQGTGIKAAEIGLLASCGITNISVYKALKVGFFSTGDELVSIGSQPSLGQIFDSNRYTIYAMIEQSGAIPIDMGVIADNPSAVEAALLSAAKHCDIIITSGGVSVGEADFITDVLANIGKIDLWKIAIKPGKPLLFGSIDDALFFGLPGNPVSVMITYQQVVLPTLRKMQGYNVTQNPITLQATTTHTIFKQPGRTEFQRAYAENINGQLVVSTTGSQGSHVLSSMTKANCLIVLPQDSGDIAKGQLVNIQLLESHL